MRRVLYLLSAVTLCFVFFIFTEGLPTVGDPDSPASTHVSPYYIENSHHDTGSPNFVTGILADYRGYDTLGETTVIFTAGVSAMLLLSRKQEDDE